MKATRRILAAVIAMMMFGTCCLADSISAIQGLIDGLIEEALGGSPAVVVEESAIGTPIEAPAEEPVRVVMEEEPETIDETNDDDSNSIDIGTYEATLLPILDTTASEWLSNNELRALFSVLLLLDLYDISEVSVTDFVDTYGVPTVFLAVPSYGYSSEAIFAAYFFGDDSSGQMIVAVYDGDDSKFSGFCSPYIGTPTSSMDVFDEGGFFNNGYYSISATDFATAVNDLNDIFNE